MAKDSGAKPPRTRDIIKKSGDSSRATQDNRSVTTVHLQKKLTGKPAKPKND